MTNILSLHKTLPQDDIAGGLRNLADQIEAGTIEGMGVITTVVVALGHTKATPRDGGEVAHEVDYEMFAWGPRKDIFTIRGLLSSVCNRL